MDRELGNLLDRIHDSKIHSFLIIYYENGIENIFYILHLKIEQILWKKKSLWRNLIIKVLKKLDWMHEFSIILVISLSFIFENLYYFKSIFNTFKISVQRFVFMHIDNSKMCLFYNLFSGEKKKKNPFNFSCIYILNFKF